MASIGDSVIRVYMRVTAKFCQIILLPKQRQMTSVSSLNKVYSTSCTLKLTISRSISVLAQFGLCNGNVQTRQFLPVFRMTGVKQNHALSNRLSAACFLEPVGVRFISGVGKDKTNYHRRTGLIYLCAAGVFMLGMSYAGVPLYRMFCQASGLGGTISRGHDTSKIETMQAVPERIIRVRFNADVSSSMRWNFRPQQSEVKIVPGETALAFYTATNPTDKPIIGISTYNVVPFEAGQYFNKIQCFCFEEQRLNPHEQVDMPVFFYIDPEFADDPKLKGVGTITLSYTFFEAKEGLQIPLPGFMTHQKQETQ